MKEDFLHYVWKFQKFDGINFFTSNNEKLHVKYPGSHNFDSGPDFFNAQIEIGGQLWAGNLEIHIKSSDWYAHNHQADLAYNNVILHVVWEHDTKVYRSDGSEIPDRKSTRLNSSHVRISYAVFCLKKKRTTKNYT